MLDHDIQKAHDRHSVLQHEAKQWRLAKLARAEQPRRTTLTARVLDRLGQSMVAWGWRLRARYGAIETIEIRRGEA